MRKFITLVISFFISFISTAQLCPGGGTNFATAVSFDPGWIVGCLSDQTCTGGTTFDNRAACEPTTTLDACAPAPSCGTPANRGSDLWFKFSASSPNVTLTVNPGVSFVSSIQAFSGGPACGTLTEIGCTVAPTPSKGTTLFLTGLIPNTTYYFRVYGTASAVGQRTGTFCFCGSDGLSGSALPVKLLSFTGVATGRLVNLTWVTTTQVSFSHFQIERSSNGINFSSVGTRPAVNAGFQNKYAFADYINSPGIYFYRLKMIDTDGRFSYSPVVKVNTTAALVFHAFMDNQTKRLVIFSSENMEVVLFSLAGSKIKKFFVKEGMNNIECNVPNGIYLLKPGGNGDVQKIAAFQ